MKIIFSRKSSYPIEVSIINLKQYKNIGMHYTQIVHILVSHTVVAEICVLKFNL